VSLRREFRSAALAAAWVLTVAGECVAQGSARPPFVEDRIAGIRVGLDRSDAIVRLYGRGFKADARGPEEQFCYWDESRQLGVQFRLDVDGVVASVNVSAVPDQIDQVCRVAGLKIGKPIAIGKVALGDSLEKVVTVYGEPKKRVDGSPEGRKVVGLGYEAQLERTPGVARSYWAALTFLDGKLVGLLVIESRSVGEQELARWLATAVAQR